MANVRFCNTLLTEGDKRVLGNVFKDPVATQAFLSLLGVVKKTAQGEFEKVSQAFLMNNDPVTRALALQQKGKVELLNELSTLIQSVVK